MKKLISLLMTLCLLCGAIALAESTDNTINANGGTATTKVSYTIQASDSFIVTIPASVTMTATGNDLSANLPITLNVDGFNVANKEIVVRLTTAAMKLVYGTNEIPYTIKIGTIDINTDDAVLTWRSSDEDQPTSATLTFAATLNGQPAGDYSDNLTFTVTVGDVTTGDENDTEDLGF